MVRLIRNVSRAVGVLALGAFVAAACADDSDRKTTATACTDPQDCAPWKCRCSGSTVKMYPGCANGLCIDPERVCRIICDDVGREFETVVPVPHLMDSPECDAFCARALSEPCHGSCKRGFVCDVDEDEGECTEGKRAFLRCIAEKGDWPCDTELPSGHDCLLAFESCSRDSGTD
jgi:hypothetical protein